MGKSGMLKTVRHSILALFVFTFSFTANAHLYDVNGSLSTPDGIDGIGSWGAGPMNLTWDLIHFDCYTCYSTTYAYTFSHVPADTFEFIIELHPSLLTNNSGLVIYDVSSTLPNWELGLFTPSATRPGMPDIIPGVRFWGVRGSTTERISFRSDFIPMWGDFYATDTSAMGAAWNAGFTNPDTDPLLPPWAIPEDGSGGFHILVPGGAGGLQVIPIPAAVWLFGSGLIGLIGIARRKKA
jgi:hypothetical protein